MKRVTVLSAGLLLLPLLVRLLMAQAPSAPPPPPTYVLTDLGPMTVGAIDSQNVKTGPTALNGTAQVAGFRVNSSFSNQFIGFLWDKGIFTDLGTGGGPTSFAYGINSTGQIVGTSNFPGDLTGNSSRAFIWQKGTMTNLNPDPNFWSRAYAINAGGDVAGFINNGPYLPVIWKGGTAAGKTMLQSLPCSLASCQGEALAINDLGQAAGWSVGGSVNVARPVMWNTNGQPTDLIPNPGFYTEANGINKGGVVVGYYQPGQLSNTPIHAFSWQNGVLSDLGALANDTNSGAWGINSKGDIVGISGTNANPILVGSGGGGRAFLNIGGIMYDLSSLLVSGTNWSLDAAYAINDNRQIVGTGRAPDLTEHGYLLTPIITPATTALSTSGTPSVFGQQVSFTATVSPTASSSLTPTGNVTFNDGSTVLGTVPLSSGTAIFNTAALAVGGHSITASYAGDNNFGASTSATLTQTVNQTATTTTVAVSPNPANFGQAVTLAATVNVVAPGAGTPTGTVTFLDGTTSLGTGTLNSARTASVSASSLGPGSHSITASYGGNANFTGSLSATTNLSVTLAAPTIATPASGYSTTNSSLTVSGTGTAGAAVVILDGTATVGTTTVSTAGSYSTTITLAVGTHSLTATQALNGVTSPASAAVSITIAPTAPVITSPASGFSTTNPSVIVTGTGTPGASVAILDGATTVGTSNVNSAGSFTATITFAVGTHSLRATQTLNSVTSAASVAVTLTVQLPPVVITDNETIHVTDTPSFPDVSDPERITITDRVNIQVLNTTSTSISAAGVVYGTPASATISVSSSTATVSGNVTLSVDGGPPTTMSLTNGSATSNLGVLKAGSHSLSATFAAQGAFIGSSAQATLLVNQATPTITWANPAPITYGTMLSSTQLNASASVPGSFVYTPAVGTVLSAGNQSLSVTFTPTDTGNYTTATGTVALLVNKVIPTINWATPVPIFYPTPLSSVQLNATASVPGSFVYSPPAGTVLSAGTQTLSVAFTPTDSTNYTTATATVSITVIPPVQIVDNETIRVTDTPSFPDAFDSENIKVTDQVVIQVISPTTTSISAPGVTYGTAATAMVSVGSPYGTVTGNVTLSVDGGTPSTMLLTSGSATFNLGVLRAGNHTLAANFAAQGNFTASSAQATLVVYQATPAITWANPAPITYGTALSSTQLNATASVSGTFTYSPTSGTVLTAGSQTLSVLFAPADTTNYTTAKASITLQVNQATPTVNWANPAPITYGTALSSTQLNATASVPGSFMYSPAAGTVLSAGSQTLVVLFTPTDTTDYTTAKASVTLQVNQATPTLKWANPALITYGTALSSTQLNATASVPGTFAYTPSAGTVLTAGSQTLVVLFTPTDTTDYTSVSVKVPLQVNQATPTITWANPAPITYGTALSSTQLNATASVPGTFLYTPAAGTVLSAGSQTLVVLFTPTDTTDYTKATATVTITVLNTIVGTNVGVTPVDTTTGSTPVTLTYSNVTKAGMTSLTTSSTGAPAPPGFQAGMLLTYYDISTTATFTGTATICIHYSGTTFIQPPHLFHLENGVWVDRTTSIDPVNMIVCGTVPSFSPFALFAPLPVLTITAPSVPRQYGLVNPPLNNVTYSGFVNGDTSSVLSGTLSCVSPATPASPVGTYPITCSGLSSPNYVVRYAAGVLTVTPALTTTSVSVSPSPVKYSDYTALTATVSPTSAGGQTLTGNVQFSLNGGTVGSAVPINSSGVATLSQVQVNLSAGSYPVEAVFTSANANFAGSTGTTTQNVAQENAFILYSGDTIAQVGTTLNLRATVWDSAAAGYPGLNPESGPTATIGDITKMWIAFDIYPAGSCGSGTPSTLYAQVALTGTAGIGVAMTALSSSSEVSYCVISRLVAGNTGGTNLFYTAPNAQGAGLDFYVNSGQFATGGGWVNDPTGSHGNFGFNARYNSTGSPKGQMVYIYRALYNGVFADFIIKSNALSALQFTGTTYPISSTLQGKVNVQVNRASDGLSLFSAGNYTFSATVTDSGQNGTTGKQFSLIVYDASGVPYHSVPAGTSLQGGNVVVHSQ